MTDTRCYINVMQQAIQHLDWVFFEERVVFVDKLSQKTKRDIGFWNRLRVSERVSSEELKICTWIATYSSLILKCSIGILPSGIPEEEIFGQKRRFSVFGLRFRLPNFKTEYGRKSNYTWLALFLKTNGVKSFFFHVNI